MPTLTRSCLSTFAAALLLSQPAFAFQSPLSDESIREAYFLGQRHDGTVPNILDKYTKRLAAPKSGPYISAVTLLTPFIQLVEYSDSFIGNFSAQQAIQVHRGKQEFVEIFVDIQLTDSYNSLIAAPDSARLRSSATLIHRPGDFWHDFQVTIFDGDQFLVPEIGRAHV